MAKKFACAATHVRHESYFLEKWIAHYEQIVGRENLYVIVDGSDWTPDVNLEGITVEVREDAPRRRVRNDRWAASTMTSYAADLRAKYEYVIRGDVDEYVTIDPNSGLSWPEAMKEVDEHGYIFALGIDVVERAGEGMLDRTQPILGQRKFGYVSNKYTKPFVISRRNFWTGGAHRLINRTVQISPNFVLFHLALCDTQLADERTEARGGMAQHKSFHPHMQDRSDAVTEASEIVPMAYDEARQIGLTEFPVEEDGSISKRPRMSRHAHATDKGLLTEVPERFFGLL